MKYKNLLVLYSNEYLTIHVLTSTCLPRMLPLPLSTLSSPENPVVSQSSCHSMVVSHGCDVVAIIDGTWWDMMTNTLRSFTIIWALNECNTKC